jgi:tRNA(fMet)-specific endonuclease VapC
VTYLLDTNACVAWLRNLSPGLVSRILSHSATDIKLCSIVVPELEFGVERADPAFRAKTAQSVDQLRGLFDSVPFDDVAAKEYGSLRADLTQRGPIIGSNDMLIAAIARVHGMTLVTHNVAEFARVTGLLIEDWQTP